MTVSSIGASLIASANQVASGGAQANTPAAAAQEAAETQAQTVKEAQNGDPVARKKLALLAAKQQHPQAAVPTGVSEPGKGAAVDHTA